jgi:hypothetical protein
VLLNGTSYDSFNKRLHHNKLQSNILMKLLMVVLVLAVEMMCIVI